MLLRTPIRESLMRPELVVPVNPVGHCGPRLGEACEVVLPGALFLEAPEEALNDSVLLGSVRSDELLGETVVFARGAKALALENESIVGANDGRCAARAKRPEAGDASFFQSPLCFLGPAAEREFVANHFSVMAIDDRGQMRPAISTTVDVRHVDRPALVAPLRLAAESLYPRT